MEGEWRCDLKFDDMEIKFFFYILFSLSQLTSSKKVPKLGNTMDFCLITTIQECKLLFILFLN
jgi:hypothetical protein